MSGALFVVRQTRRAHDELAALLEGLTKASRGDGTQSSLTVRSALYPTAADEKIRGAMERRVLVEFVDTPLKEGVAYLSARAEIPFRFDERALDHAGFDLDTRVNRVLSDVRLRTALELILEPLNLVCVPDHGFALITTKDKADARQFTVVYDVRDLLEKQNVVDLMNVVWKETGGMWEVDNGHGGTLNPVATGLFVVRQTERVHEEIEAIFAAMRRKQYARFIGDIARDATAQRKKKTKPAKPDTFTIRLHLLPPDPEERRELAETIPKIIAPDSWKGADAGTLSVAGNKLVVRHRREIQQQIEKFLDDYYEEWEPAAADRSQ